MDLFQYQEKHGAAAVTELAAKAGTSAKYLEHIILFRKRPGADLAHRLIVASGDVLTVGAMMLSTDALAAKRVELHIAKAAKKTADMQSKNAEAAERRRVRAAEDAKRKAAAIVTAQQALLAATTKLAAVTASATRRKATAATAATAAA